MGPRHSGHRYALCVTAHQSEPRRHQRRTERYPPVSDLNAVGGGCLRISGCRRDAFGAMVCQDDQRIHDGSVYRGACLRAAAGGHRIGVLADPQDYPLEYIKNRPPGKSGGQLLTMLISPNTLSPLARQNTSPLPGE